MERNWFRQRRDELEKTQREMAIASGKTERAIANWELGHSTPRLSEAPDLSKVYAVTEARFIKAIVEQTQELASSR